MNILYISYDGLTDFIGQSQILPYLLGCAADGHQLTVISFEKAERKLLVGNAVDRRCREAGIRWLPRKFRSSPPYLAKLMDQQAMQRAALAAASREQFDLVHCRSYQAGLAGLAVKRRNGTRLLFDMRGFLPDSRREGGRWSASTLLGRTLYSRWKSHEASLVAGSDHIISLTDAARQEIRTWAAYRGTPISVIPCCADFDHFRLLGERERERARAQLNFSRDDPVLGYLGSRGTIYMIGEHLRLFNAIRARLPATKALFVGNPDPSDIFEVAGKQGIELSAEDIRVVQAERAHVPFWLNAMDTGTCLYTPTYSSIHVSPTKMAEYLACGVPMISNGAVGDVEALNDRLKCSHIMRGFADNDVEAAASAFFELRSSDRGALRSRAQHLLDLPNAISAYLDIYNNPGTSVNAWQ